MALLDYTSYDQIRSALGMNNVEIPDSVLSLEMYSSNLSVELDDLDLSIQTTFETVDAILPASRTRDQQRFLDTTKLLATYTVAKQYGISMPMSGPKSISDSKTEISRFNDSPYKETVKAIKTQCELYKQRTLAALAALTSATVTSTRKKVMLVSAPSTDPVTGT
jgi:hypothetical protein